MIVNLIEIENAHINTNHPDFVGSADTLLNLFQGEQEYQEEGDPFEQAPPSHTLFDKGKKAAQEAKGKLEELKAEPPVSKSVYVGKPSQKEEQKVAKP